MINLKYEVKIQCKISSVVNILVNTAQKSKYRIFEENLKKVKKFEDSSPLFNPAVSWSSFSKSFFNND